MRKIPAATCFLLLAIIVLFPAPSNAQLQPIQQTAAIFGWLSGSAVYARLPYWTELSREQQRLVQTAMSCPSSDWPMCWLQQSDEARAAFFMITYSLERTPVGGKPLIGRVRKVEGILVPSPVTHVHAPTNVTGKVDGWRIHLELDGLSAQSLSDWDRGTPPAHKTHATFGFNFSFRDHREQSMHDGPFLQLVLNDANTGNSSDSDLDRGAILHLSSPKHLYSRFRKRYQGVETVLKIR